MTAKQKKAKQRKSREEEQRRLTRLRTAYNRLAKWWAIYEKAAIAHVENPGSCSNPHQNEIDGLREAAGEFAIACGIALADDVWYQLDLAFDRYTQRIEGLSFL